MSADLSRRTVLALAAGWAASFARGAAAVGRKPVGGSLSMRIPWPIATIDPHRSDDVAAAVLGPALFDSLFAVDDSGAIGPALAETLPEGTSGRVTVRLRRGLRSASGRPITAKDAVSSLTRARAAGAVAWLSEIGRIKAESAESLSFAFRDPPQLARLLASPLTAIVPAAFVAEQPDGTGPLRAERHGDDLVLRRNDLAANGPAFLDEVVVRPAPDLAASLLAFEGGTDDVGWLGTGLHEPRPGARPFDAGACAWAILRTGSLAAAWDAPGIAQRICDGIPPASLAYLALGAAWPTETDEGWGGPPCELLVRDDCPWLRELARAVSASIGRPGHDVTPRPIPAAEFVSRRAARAYALALDVQRPLGPAPIDVLLSLATSDDRAAASDLAKHPPRTESGPRAQCRTLRIGVLGEVRVQGGRAAQLALALGPGHIDFGATTRARATR